MFSFLQQFWCQNEQHSYAFKPVNIVLFFSKCKFWLTTLSDARTIMLPKIENMCMFPGINSTWVSMIHTHGDIVHFVLTQGRYPAIYPSLSPSQSLPQVAQSWDDRIGSYSGIQGDTFYWEGIYMDGPVQDCSNYRVLTMELLQFWTKPLICIHKLSQRCFR